MSKRVSKKRAGRKQRSKNVQAEGRKHQQLEESRDLEEQLRIGRKIMAEYREVFEKLAKG